MNYLFKLDLKMKNSFLFILASCLVCFACNQEHQKLDETQAGQIQGIERTSEIIKVNVGDATFEFSITRNHDGSVGVEKRLVDYDPNSHKSGVFVNSGYITQTGNKSFKINELGTVKHFYIPFGGGTPIEILATGSGGGGGEYYCECEGNYDEYGGIHCELDRGGYGQWTHWVCDGDCQDCDMRWCPSAMPALDTATYKLFGLIIEAPNVTFYEVEDRNSNIGIFYGGNCRIEISKSPTGDVLVSRQLVQGNYPLNLYNYSSATPISNKLSYESNQSYWLIPFDLGSVAEKIGSGGVEPHCTADGCNNGCEMRENSKKCLECFCKEGGNGGDCDMISSSKGVVVSGTNISIIDQ